MVLLCDFLQQTSAVSALVQAQMKELLGRGANSFCQGIENLGKSGVDMMHDQRERTEVGGLEGSKGSKLSHAGRRGG